jgi:hypothetical protein
MRFIQLTIKFIIKYMSYGSVGYQLKILLHSLWVVDQNRTKKEENYHLLFIPRENIGKNNLLSRSSYKKNLWIKINELTQNWLATHLPCVRVQNHNSVKELFQLIQWRLPDIIFSPALPPGRKHVIGFLKLFSEK